MKWFAKRLTAGIMAVGMVSAYVASGAAPEGAADREPFYRSSYDTAGNLAHWSKPVLDKTAGDAMLGPFGADTETLTLADLPPHAFVRLRAKLVILGPWQGAVPKGSADCVSISLKEGRNLLNASFVGINAPAGAMQSYPDNVEQGEYPAQTGASERNVSWAPAGNVVYDIDFSFPHRAGELGVIFQGLGALGVETGRRWGVGAVRVDLLDRAPVKLDAAGIKRLMEDLRGKDPAAVELAIRTLVSAGDEPMGLVRGWLAEQTATAAQRMPALIGQLDDSSFDKRDLAQRGLLEMGTPALSLLQDEQRGDHAPEVMARLKAVEEGIVAGGTNRWEPRLARVLDAIGTERARAVAGLIAAPVDWPSLEVVKKRFGNISDTEWNVLSVHTQKVLDAMNDPAIKGAMSARNRQFAGSPEMRTLANALSAAPVPDADLKQLLAGFRNSRVTRLTTPEFRQLNDARQNLMKLLTIRQEAILVSMGVLE